MTETEILRDYQRRAYRQWAASAKHRGIAVELTLRQWCEVWGVDWFFKDRDDLVMCRKKDEGPYAVGNVYIATRAQNSRDYWIHGPGRLRPVRLRDPSGGAPAEDLPRGKFHMLDSIDSPQEPLK